MSSDDISKNVRKNYALHCFENTTVLYVRNLPPAKRCAVEKTAKINKKMKYMMNLVIIIYTLQATMNVIHNMHQRSTILRLKVLNSFINITQMYFTE